MKKRGNIVVDHSVGFFISLVGVVFLIVFLWLIYAPQYDEDIEISKSYFGMFEGAIDIADSGGVGEFVMLDMGEKDVNFYLVFFGSTPEFNAIDRHFSSSKVGDNVVCSCFSNKYGLFCKYCSDLELPFSYNNNNEDMRILREGERIEVSKKESYYEIVG